MQDQQEKFELIDVTKPDKFESYKAKQLWFKQMKNSYLRTYFVDGKKIKIRVFK